MGKKTYKANNYERITEESLRGWFFSGVGIIFKKEDKGNEL